MVVLAGQNAETLDFRGYGEGIKQFFLYESERISYGVFEWLKNLNPITDEPNRQSTMYGNCYILFLVWQNDDFNCLIEAEALKRELEDRWGINGIIYKIPSIKPQWKLQQEVEQVVKKFIEDYDGDSNLLLIHYGGHGMIGKRRDYYLGMGQERILWAPIRNLLLSCKADVAIFIDACFAAAAVYRVSYRHTVELIGCPEKTVTLGSGPRTFTKMLLQAFQTHPNDQMELRYLNLEVQSPSQGQVDFINRFPEANPKHYTIRKSDRGHIILRRRPLVGTDGIALS